MVNFRDHPLLNTPNLCVIMLKAAAHPASIEDCAGRLAELLEAAGEHPPVAPEEIRRQFEILRRNLAQARLLAPTEDGRFVLTERGARALREHARGFDTADLMIYPEFADHVRRIEAERGRREDPRESSYNAGCNAHLAGALLADNPFRPDTTDHLAWENGWSAASLKDTR